MAIGIGVIVVGVVVAVCLAVWDPRPRLKVGQVVDRVGEYRYPSGDRRLKIIEDADGNIAISTQYRVMRYYLFPVWFENNNTLFESERDWFATVDQYERLWVYHGPWDKAWGPKRKMPSGGTVPYPPAVIVDGVIPFGRRGFRRGSMVVSSIGDWRGVPWEFFHRIPDKNDGTWGHGQTIPATPLVYSVSDEREIEKEIRER
ncbi:hypothetical protein [Lacunimicrobium album]